MQIKESLMQVRRPQPAALAPLGPHAKCRRPVTAQVTQAVDVPFGRPTPRWRRVLPTIAHSRTHAFRDVTVCANRERSIRVCAVWLTFLSRSSGEFHQFHSDDVDEVISRRTVTHP